MRSTSAISAVIVGALLVCGVGQVLGRKCVCTSKACKENGVKICRTRFSCYTELIYNGDAKTLGATTKTTRGCTEGATPLLCETKSWRSSAEENSSSLNSLELLGRVAWPRLTCCDSHDYCNAADEDFEPTGRPEDNRRAATADARNSNISNPSDLETTETTRDRPASVTVTTSSAGANSNVQQLHVAALLLAVAALISVFAACYVVTRFLNASHGAGTASGGNVGLPRIIGPYGNRLDF